MNSLLIPCGISGSGKSFLGSWLQKKSNIEIVCPDDIRLEKFGDINDQKNGGLVFNIANKRIASNLKNHKNVYFSATNLSLNRTIKDIVDTGIFEDLNPVEVHIILLGDSNDVDLCKSRIKKDLDNDIVRSSVPDEVVDKQHSRYLSLKHDIDSIVFKWKDTIGGIDWVEDYGPNWTKVSKMIK
jgi:predicted kinase